MDSPNNRRFWIILVVTYPLLILLFQPTSINTYDESIVLLGALQVQNGIFPGNGFFTMYGPLQFFVSAGLLNVFDDNILAPRLYHVATIALTHLLLAGLFRPTESHARLAMACLFLVLSAFFISKHAAPLYPTHMLGVFGAIFVACKIQEWPLGPITVALLLSIYVAFFVFLAPVNAAIVVVMLLVAIPFHLFNRMELSTAAVLREVARWALACGGAGLIVLAYETTTDGALTATVHFLLTEQIPVYAEYRALPFPTASVNSGTMVQAYFPLLVLGVGGLYYFYCAAHRSQYTQRYRSTFFWLLFFCLAFYPSGLVRTHNSQLWPSFLFALTAAFLVVCHALDHMGNDRRKLWASRSVFVLSAVLLAAFATSWIGRKNIFASDCDIAALTTPRVSCLHAGPSKDWPQRQEQIVFLEGFLGQDERLFVTQDRHDMIYISDHDFYFLLDRLPLTRWAHLEPGIQTTAIIQDLIIADIRAQARHHGRAVVLVQPARPSREPNKSAVSSGVTRLDDFIRQCTTAKEMGNLQIVVCT